MSSWRADIPIFSILLAQEIQIGAQYCAAHVHEDSMAAQKQEDECREKKPLVTSCCD